MGKKLDKKAQAAVAKAAKGVKAAKVDKAVKKFRKLEGKLWTREYLLKIRLLGVKAGFGRLKDSIGGRLRTRGRLWQRAPQRIYAQGRHNGGAA